MGYTVVRSHTRRGYAVQAHTRRTDNRHIQDVLRRDIEHITNRYQSMPVCSHVGQFLAYGETGVTFFVCQPCQRHIGYPQMQLWAKEGRVKREQIEIAEEARERALAEGEEVKLLPMEMGAGKSTLKTDQEASQA